MREGFKRRGGFTLIELMITVAIVAILSAIAYPSYLSYVRKGNRTDARSLLQAASLAQEKWRLNNAAYTANTTDLVPPCPNSGTCYSASSNGTQHYSLAISGASGSAYTLTATAVTSIQQGDTSPVDCTVITYAVSGTSITYTPNGCWGK